MPISLELIEAAEAYMSAKRAVFDGAVDYVTEASGVSREAILSKERREPVVTWRQIAMARCVEGGLSEPETGRFFGKDHTTVRAAIRKVKGMANA